MSYPLLHAIIGQTNINCFILQIVGVVGVELDTKMGVADIGPLAVRQSHQRRGIGARIMSTLEMEFPVTAVGVVSCRSVSQM